MLMGGETMDIYLLHYFVLYALSSYKGWNYFDSSIANILQVLILSIVIFFLTLLVIKLKNKILEMLNIWL